MPDTLFLLVCAFFFVLIARLIQQVMDEVGDGTYDDSFDESDIDE